MDDECTCTVRRELIHCCLFRTGQNPAEDEIAEMVDEADADGSGSINFPEFIGLMLKKQRGGMTKDEIKQVKDGVGFSTAAIGWKLVDEVWGQKNKTYFITL